MHACAAIVARNVMRCHRMCVVHCHSMPSQMCPGDGGCLINPVRDRHDPVMEQSMDGADS